MTTTTQTPRGTADGRAEDRPVAELVRDLSAQLSTLVRQEIELARLELTEKGKRAGAGASMLGAAGALAFFGAATLIGAAVAALDLVVATWLAFVIVAVVLLAVAGILGISGKNRTVSALPPTPERAIASAKEDVRFTKEHVQEARR